MSNPPWTAAQVLTLASGSQSPSILLAAAELDLFAALADQSLSAADLARMLSVDPRALTTLLDALAALNLLGKHGQQYQVPAELQPLLSAGGKGSLLAMLQHQANCQRRWAELARVVKTGKPAERRPSIRGEAADYASFIEAMDNLAAPIASQVIAELEPLHFTRLLDVGGGSGTWTLAFLRSHRDAKATIFDLPHVRAQAETRILTHGMAQRVAFVAGDYMVDSLPQGADLAWVSAIIHSLSRAENRKLFQATFAALVPGGQILIRDLVMAPSRTAPLPGALFAINMLVGTPGGGTYTFQEVREDLEAAGFKNARILRDDGTMHAVIAAAKPA